jgi:hypothetical protein
MLTEKELEMLRFPEGISYAAGLVTAESPELLARAHGLLRLGAFKVRRVKAGIKVYGATESTHNGYGSVWLGSGIASGLRKKHYVIEVGSSEPARLTW